MAKYASGGFLRAGAPISAILRTVTQTDWEDNSNSEDVTTLTKDRGSTSGVRSASVSATCAVPLTGTEIKRITACYEAGTEFDLYGQFGTQLKHARGTIKSIKTGAQVNKMVEISFTFSGSAEATQDA